MGAQMGPGRARQGLMDLMAFLRTSRASLHSAGRTAAGAGPLQRAAQARARGRASQG